MSRSVVLDEILLMIRVPANLAVTRVRAVRRILASRFLNRLQEAINTLVANDRVLAAAGVSVRIAS